MAKGSSEQGDHKKASHSTDILSTRNNKCLLFWNEPFWLSRAQCTKVQYAPWLKSGVFWTWSSAFLYHVNTGSFLTDICGTYLGITFQRHPQCEILHSSTVDMVLSLRNCYLSKITVLFLHVFYNYKLLQILFGTFTINNNWKWLTWLKHKQI